MKIKKQMMWAVMFLCAATCLSGTHSAVSGPTVVDTRDYQLIVESDYGIPFPAVGTNTYVWGAVITASVFQVVTEEGVSYSCAGWTGTGAVPSSGTTNIIDSITFSGATNSSIVWDWELANLVVSLRNIGGVVSTNLGGTVTVEKTIDGNLTGELKPGDENWNSQWEMPGEGQTVGFRGYYAGENAFENSPTAELWAEGEFTETGDGSNTLVLVRNMPYVQSLELVRASDWAAIPTNAVFSKSAVNEFLYRATVVNDTDSSKEIRFTFKMGDEANLISKLENYSDTVTRVIPPGSTVISNVFYANQVHATGVEQDFYKAVRIETMVDGNLQKTDAWDWVPAFGVVNLDAATPKPAVNFGNLGLSWSYSSRNNQFAGLSTDNADLTVSGSLMMEVAPGGIGTELATLQGECHYGVYTVRMKAPSSTSDGGACTGFFYYLNDNSEIDIEFRTDHPGTVDFTVHRSGMAPATKSISVPDASITFHDYTFDWRDDRVNFYVDGVNVFTVTEGIPSSPGILLLNCWSGNSDWGGISPLSSTYQAEIEEVIVRRYRPVSELPLSIDTKALAFLKEDPTGCVGTGFMISPGFMLTAGHNIGEATDKIDLSSAYLMFGYNTADSMVIPYFPDPRAVLEDQGKGDYKNSGDDYAIVKVSGDTHKIPYLNINGSNIQVGDNVYAVGFPNGGLNNPEEMRFMEGRITKVNSPDSAKYFETDFVVFKGNSGGPIFNEDGEVIGIVSAFMPEEARSHFYKISELLEHHGLQSYRVQKSAGADAVFAYTSASVSNSVVSITIVNQPISSILDEKLGGYTAITALDIGPDGTKFDPPAILRMDYNSALAGVGNRGKIFQKQADGSWDRLDTTYHDNNTVTDPTDDYWTASVSHLCKFALCVPVEDSEWLLTVTGGEGTGRYAHQAVVTVTADAAPAGQVFERWIGDTQYVANVTSSIITVTMPAEAIRLESVYQKSGLGHLGSFLLEGLHPDEVKSANQWFRTAVNQDPLDYPARVYSAVTLLLNLMNDAELLDLMEQFGFTFEEDLSVGGWTVEGELNFTSAPPSNEAVDTVWERTQPALDEALALLVSIPDTWTGSAEISAEIFPVDETVYVDYADTVAARALLASLRSFLNTARAYDLTVDYPKFEWPVTLPEGEITLDGDPSDWAGIPVQLAGEDESDLRSVKACISGNTVFALIESELLLKDGGGYMGLQLNVQIDGEEQTLDAVCWIEPDAIFSEFEIGGEELYEAQAVRSGRYLELAFPVPSELTLNLGGTVVRTEHAAWWEIDEYFWEWSEEELEFPHHHPAGSLLTMAPGLLRSVRNEEALTQARSDLADGLAFGRDAGERIRSRSGGPLRFFEYDPADEEEYTRLTGGLADASDSLAAPKRIDTFGYNDGLTVHLGALYAAPFVTRDMLPAYAPEALWNRPVEGSFPDPTFGGVFPLLRQDDLSAIVNRTVFNEPDLCMLQVVSQYGAPLPAPGTHWFFKDSAVTCSVPLSVISDGINLRCTGWTGTGSVPASDSTNTTGEIVLTHLQSSIQWNWETSFAVTNLVVQQRPGMKLVDITYDVISDVTNAVHISLTVLNGSVSIPVQTVTGDIGVVPPGAGKTAVWDAGADWNGQSGELTLSVLHASQPQFISTGSGAVNTLDCRLAVAAAPESGVQISGTHPGTSAYTNLLAYRTAVELTAPESYGSGTNRMRFVEWSGSVTTSVRTVSFAMNEDKDLVAVYGIERIIQVTAPRNGRIDPAGTVAAAQGYPHTFTATPDQGYRLKHWLVDGSIAGEGQGSLTVDVTGNRTIAAVFEPVWLVFEGRSQRQKLDESGGKRGEPAVLKDTLSTLLIVNRDRFGETNAVLVSWGKRGEPSAVPVAVSMDDSYLVSAKVDKDGRLAAERNLWSLSIRDDGGKSLLIGTFDGAYRYDKAGVLLRVQQRASLNGTGLVPEDPSFSAGLLRLNQTAGDMLNKQDGNFDEMAAALRTQIKKLPSAVNAGILGGLLKDAAGE